jgi:hypothetical protein
MVSGAVIAGMETQGFNWNNESDSQRVRQLLLSGFDDPDHFFRSNAYSEVLKLLVGRPDFAFSVFPYDSLIEGMKRGRRQYELSLTALCGIACFAGDRKAGCGPLLESGSIVAWMLEKHEQGLSIFSHAQKAGCASAADSVLRLRSFIENDREIARLLSVDMPEGKALQTYTSTLEKAFSRHPNTTLKKQVFLRLGDCFSALKRYSRMKKWYSKAVVIDPALYDLTLIRYRLEIYAHLQMKQGFLATAAVLGCFVFFLMMFLATVKRGSFDVRYFFGKLAVFTVIFGICSVGVVSTDVQQARHLFHEQGSSEAIKRGVTEPVVVLSMLDSLFIKKGVWLLFVGFAPLLVGVYCTSFRGFRPRWLSVAATLASVLAVWITLFFLRIEEDQKQYGWARITPARLYFDGELESVFRQYPEKVLHANPGILKSSNSDLKAFMDSYFPDGIDKKQR